MDYFVLYQQMVVNPVVQIQAAEIARSIRAEPRYKVVERSTGVSADLIGVLHYMESGRNFNTHLHNGDSLSRRTVNVPAGRPRIGKPPFSWVDSAIDALEYDRVTTSHNKGDQCEAAVFFNGKGYERRGIVSPYGFSGTNLYSRGKFVRDGVFNPTAVSKQVGACVILRELEKLDDVYKQEKEPSYQLPVIRGTNIASNSSGVSASPSTVIPTTTNPVVNSPATPPSTTTGVSQPTKQVAPAVFRQPDPRAMLSKYFRVGEFNKEGQRPFVNQKHLDACKRLALALDDVRERYGAPITITSGIRTPEANRQAGGASNSYHLTTRLYCAADIIVRGVSNRKVFADYNATWEGGLGLYSVGNGTTHFDLGQVSTTDAQGRERIERSSRRWDWSKRSSNHDHDHDHEVLSALDYFDQIVP